MTQRVTPTRRLPEVAARTECIADGRYVAYIDYRVDAGDAVLTESFPAGVFNDAGKAHAAACRLKQTFIESVLPEESRSH